jgi:hypothetical protein
MEKQTVYIIVACILAVCIPVLPKIIQVRVWILRKIHLFRLADWVERNMAVLVLVFRVIFAAAILVLLLLAAGAI